MKRALWLFAVACAVKAGSLSLTYPDGTSLTIEIASTGATVLGSYNGAVESQGTVWNRVVYDKTGKAIFAYAVDAGREAVPWTFFVRIKPVDEAYARKLRAGGVPTVSSPRQFDAIQSGQSVALDILQNPSTGEKIYDLLRPSPAAKPGELAFDKVSITVNGQAVKELEGAGISGAGVLIYIPGHGAWILAESERAGFRQLGHVDGGRLWFEIDGDKVEIQSKGTVASAGKNVVWVRHEAGWLPEAERKKLAGLQTVLAELKKTHSDSHPRIKWLQKQIAVAETQAGAPEIRSADRVEWLLGK
jgi:hypothetical protein